MRIRSQQSHSNLDVYLYTSRSPWTGDTANSNVAGAVHMAQAITVPVCHNSGYFRIPVTVNVDLLNKLYLF